MSVRVEVRDLVKHYRIDRARNLQAVNGVSFTIEPGQTLGLVGESGAGKSTIGRCLLRLTDATSGQILFGEEDLTELSGRDLRAWRATTQMVFQDPYDSLNPRKRVRSLLEEPLKLHTEVDRLGRLNRARELLDLVRLPTAFLTRFPGELSGGEAQRVGIARAIATDPKFLVLDEPTSSLDLSVRAGVLKVLDDLQVRLGMTYLLISHDLHTIAAHTDRVAVMYLGSIVEVGPAQRVFEDPQHPYTQALLSSSLSPDPTTELGRHVLQGEIPSPIDLPTGCLFASRCPLVRDDCLGDPPAHLTASVDHTAACVRLADGTHKLDAPTVRDTG